MPSHWLFPAKAEGPRCIPLRGSNFAAAPHARWLRPMMYICAQGALRSYEKLFAPGRAGREAVSQQRSPIHCVRYFASHWLFPAKAEGPRCIPLRGSNFAAAPHARWLRPMMYICAQGALRSYEKLFAPLLYFCGALQDHVTKASHALSKTRMRARQVLETSDRRTWAATSCK